MKNRNSNNEEEENLTTFNVLEYDFNRREISSYDVLPYFRRVWFDSDYDAFEKSEVKNKSDLQRWIKDASMYNFWSRCQYEFIMLPWPYNEDKIFDEMKKVDVHYQVMMNISIITDILSLEFNIKE